MTFATKFESGDELYLLKEKRILKGKVTRIDYLLHAYDDGHNYVCETYTLKTSEGPITYHVSDLFRTKEELINSLG